MAQNFAKHLIKWYKIYGRNLPWRNTNDPYKIWLSEVILQQTRVEQGLTYYNSFVERYPSLQNLANADIDEIMKMWQGLGYYSRARNLYSGAIQIMREHQGIFPSDYKSIRKIKGIGDYTAGAISSIAFNLPMPAVDGNVLRVMSRIKAISTPIDKPAGKNQIYTVLLDLIDKKEPGNFNQALMELGATVCHPRSPRCLDCPVQEFCQAFFDNTIQSFPVKSSRQKPKDRFFLYLIPTFKSGEDIFTLMKRRNKGDIWQNLYDFPLIESSDSEGLSEDNLPGILEKTFNNTGFTILKISGTIKHQLTHQTIYTRFLHLYFETPPQFAILKEYEAIPLNKVHEFAVPRLIDRYMDSNNILFT